MRFVHQDCVLAAAGDVGVTAQFLQHVRSHLPIHRIVVGNQNAALEVEKRCHIFLFCKQRLNGLGAHANHNMYSGGNGEFLRCCIR
jgi:hypothetical protein